MSINFINQFFIQSNLSPDDDVEHQKCQFLFFLLESYDINSKCFFCLIDFRKLNNYFFVARCVLF